MPDGTITVILQSIKRFRSMLYLTMILSLSQVHYLDDYLAEQDSATIKAIADSLKENAIQIVRAPVWLRAKPYPPYAASTISDSS